MKWLLIAQLVFSPHARAQMLELSNQLDVEHAACMVGSVADNVAHVDSLVTLGAERAGRRYIVPAGACADVAHTLGVVHSHPDSERCWYLFPGTLVSTSDLASFLAQPWPIDAIACGSIVVWVNRASMQGAQQL